MTPFAGCPSLPVRLAVDHPWRVVLAWVVVIAASIALIVGMLGDALDGDEETTNNPESQQALALLNEHLPDRPGPDEVVIVSSDRYRVGSPQFDAFLGTLIAQAGDIGVAGAAPTPPGAGAGGDWASTTGICHVAPAPARGPARSRVGARVAAGPINPSIC